MSVTPKISSAIERDVPAVATESPSACDPAMHGGDRNIATIRQFDVERWHHGSIARVSDLLAEEVPVALTYQGVPHVVMLATPSDLDDLAVGFTLSEAIVAQREEIRSVETAYRDDLPEVRIGIAPARFTELLRRQRNLTGRTGCGLCGAATVEDAIRNPAAVSHALEFTTQEMHANLAALNDHQPINRQAGSVHAAAWAVPGRSIRFVREDVGRHNALDKVIGAVVRAGEDFQNGYFIVTSRASYEMVQKAATVGAGALIAVSAPTAFAVRLAQSTGLTLVGFAREHQHVVYAHPQRIRNV